MLYLQGGVYLVNFLNVYGPGIAILFVVFVEAAGVFWFYGVDNFSSDIEQMLGKKPSIYWRLCWKYVSPTFLFVILIFSLLGYEDMLGSEYKYPEWSGTVGWILTLSSVICIPGYMVVKFLISPGGFKHVSLLYTLFFHHLRANEKFGFCPSVFVKFSNQTSTSPAQCRTNIQ